MKESQIYYQLDCKQYCSVPHSTRRHGEIPAKRFKNQVDQFLSQDDWLWEDAIGIQHKLEQLQASIRKLKEETMQSIYTKKLSYALAFDKADDIEKSFRAVRDGDWKNLTCTNIFRVHEKLNKGRKVEQRDVKALTRTIIQDTQKAADLLVKSCFAGSNESRYEQKPDRRQYRRRQEQKQQRPRKVEERAPRESQKVEESTFNNGYPTVKVNKIFDIDTHFNVVLKVVRVHKEFRIGTLNKIQFVGGDETGISNVVIDKQSFIRTGVVVSISNARIYSFHGIKQIQPSNKNSSEIKEERIIINNVNEQFNLSKKQGRPRQDRPERGYRDRRQDRPPRQDRTERRPRQDKPQRGERRPRQDRPQREERRPRQDRDRRPFRADRRTGDEEQQDKKVRREPREQQRRYEKRVERKQEERPSRNRHDDKSEVSHHSSKVTVKQERDYGKSKEQSSSSSADDDDKVEQQSKAEKGSSPIKDKGNYTKIGKIEPGDEELTIIAQVYEIQTKGPPAQKGHFLSRIGDETGTVRIELPKSNPLIKEGAVIRFMNVNVEVDQRDHRITLKLAEDGICDKTMMRIPKIQIDNDISEHQWQSDGEQQEEDEKKEAVIEDF